MVMEGPGYGVADTGGEGWVRLGDERWRAGGGIKGISQVTVALGSRGERACVPWPVYVVHQQTGVLLYQIISFEPYYMH